MNGLLKHPAGLNSRLQRIIRSRMKPERLVGLDISMSEIKLAVMERSRNRINLEICHSEVLKPDDPSKPGKALDRMQSSLDAIVCKYNLEGVKTVSLIPFENVDTRLVILPKMPGKELRRALEFEAKKFSNIPAGRAYIDKIKVESFDQEGAKYVSYLAVVADKLDLEQTVDLVRNSGLDLVGLTLPPVALGNIIRRTKGEDEARIVAALDMSGSEMSFTLFEEDKLRFTRDIPVGRDSIKDALRTIVVAGDKTVQLEDDRIEEMIRLNGIIDESNSEGETRDGIPFDKIAVMLRPVLEKMLVEIQRSIDFCQEQFGLPPPQRLFLCGRGVEINNFKEYISARLRIDASYLSPEDSGGASAGMGEGVFLRAAFGTAVGCAIAACGSAGLLTPAFVLPGSHKHVRTVLNAAAVMGLVAVISLHILGGMQEKKTDLLINECNNAISNLDTFEQSHKDENKMVRTRKFKREMLLNLVGPEIPWGQVLKDLSNRLAYDIELDEINLVSVKPEGAETADYRLYFHGLVSMQARRVETAVSQMLTGLAESPFLDDIRLESVQALRGGVAKIDFNCRLVS